MLADKEIPDKSPQNYQFVLAYSLILLNLQYFIKWEQKVQYSLNICTKKDDIDQIKKKCINAFMESAHFP